jgi:hypothetical protein
MIAFRGARVRVELRRIDKEEENGQLGNNNNNSNNIDNVIERPMKAQKTSASVTHRLAR